MKAIFNARWLTTRGAEIALATFLVFLFTLALDQRERDRFDSIPATDWFEVSEIFVPDHEVGTNPAIVYDRTIHRDFVGFWVVEVQRRDQLSSGERFFSSCSGSGTNRYETTDYLDPESVTWSWFIGRNCSIAPGAYRLVVTYDMRVTEFDSVKSYRVLSNVFHVYAPTGQ